MTSKQEPTISPSNRLIMNKSYKYLDEVYDLTNSLTSTLTLPDI